jgi:sec-independent protein translocase protein TatB
MFDIGWSELLVIVVVAIVVVGPKELPKLMRTFGHYAGKLRRAASEFQRQFDEAMRDTEVAEVKKAIETMRTEAASLDLKATLDKPVMLPTPVAAPAKAEETAPLVPPAVKVAEAKTEIKAETKPKPARKSASTKPKSSPKSSGAKRGKPPAEPGP